MNLNFSSILDALSKRSLLLVGVVLLLLLILLGYLLVVGPLLNRISDLAEERDAREAELSGLVSEVRDLERVRDNSGELVERILELNRRIPEEPEIPTFVVQVQEIAEASGVTQVRLTPGTPGAPAQGGPYSIVPITMTFEGTYEDLRDFLLRASELSRLVTVNAVAYDPVPDAQGEGAAEDAEPLLNVEIEAEIYFQPEGNSESAAPVSPETTTSDAGTTATEETTVVQ